MRITERDVEWLKWINHLGFVDVNQISQKYKIAKVTAYARLQKLVKHQYLLHEFLLHNAPGYYYVTKHGASMAGDHIPALKQVMVSKYNHDKHVASLSILLTKHYLAPFITEREIRHEQGIRKRGERDHISDGVLALESGNIAIEVELSTKGRWRLKRIMDHYALNIDIKEVWYFCGNNEIKNLIARSSADMNNVKVFLLDEYMNDKERCYGVA